jgi:hypothetical protein
MTNVPNASAAPQQPAPAPAAGRAPLPVDPTESVGLRAGAAVEPAVLRLTSDAAVKQNLFTSRPGYAHSMAKLETHLHVEAWVRNSTYAKQLWVDVHVFADGGALVHRETLPLHYTRPAGDGGDLFVVDAPLFQGPIASPGSVERRPDVRLLEYRLYGELAGRVVTDGVLHRCVLRSDTAGH